MICGGPHLRCEPLPARFEIDGDWEGNLSPWDVAAGLEGGDTPHKTGDIVAGNEAIHRELLRTLKVARG